MLRGTPTMGEEWQNSEDTAFQPEEVEPLLSDVVAKVLANAVYDEAKVAGWVDLICDQSLVKLTAMNKPFKYVVTCILMQKNGAGVHTGQSCFWDVANDNCARVSYPLAGKKPAYDPRMYCVVTCFGVSM